MTIALDTNVLAYAEGTNGRPMRDKAVELLERIPSGAVVIPVQTLGELFNILVRKAKQSPARAQAAVLTWCDSYPTAETSTAVMVSAAELATRHRLAIWDSIVLATAAEARCSLLLSEDLQEGFTWRGVTVSNPFLADVHPLLAALVAKPRD